MQRREPTAAEHTAHDAALAKRLGVTTAELQKALATARASMPQAAEGRGHYGPDATALAKTLGVDATKLQKAPGAHRPTARTEAARKASLTAMAKELGISEAKLQAALEAQHRGEKPQARPNGTDPLATVLAKALNREVSKVSAALQAEQSNPPEALGGHGPEGHFGH